MSPRSQEGTHHAVRTPLCLQNDIHAPGTTVYEALEFSAQMRLIDVSQADLKQFVGQVSTSTGPTCSCQQPPAWLFSHTPDSIAGYKWPLQLLPRITAQRGP